MKKKRNIMIICTILFLTFKVYSKNIVQDIIVQNKFFDQECRKQLKNKNFFNVINHLELLNKKNTNYLNSAKIKIYLIYSYYKVSNFIQAQKQIIQFIKLYPKHPNIDYVLYIQSLINISLDKNIYFNNFSIKHYKINPIHAKIAFFQLKNLINHYPRSIYVRNAKKELFYLKKRLMTYDFKIMKYYFLHNQYIAVINRGEKILQKYPEIPEVINTLEYIKKSFFALKIFNTSEKISRIISLNSN
ncbi:outer membrane protein assembly factor BamD [Buchnera aphidicola (Melanaphis sacchari)]|uniref:Outer membrane protein assembly factor BamD n=1 Tax=Buchnera aphidicola (Melanaphis sacchari) TaxID=2173854 RepID=A0A2U8DGH8_9GAMM|nr:outer membrane protein assembly factor BamD [Buchnera aphidicola]AWH90394.1 outer membrane protein assembly factor BamD [Buchnera aphidicola (Melanaphis sacchari)]